MPIPAAEPAEPLAAPPNPEIPADAAPRMTPTLLARLFIVPAVLVSMLVVGLVVVVVLFGWSSIGQRPATKDLIAALNTDTGDRQAGVLFPDSKEVWLAAKELAERLQHRDRELKPAEIGPAVEQLSLIVKPLLKDHNLSQGQRLKTVFILMALGRLDTPASAEMVAQGLTSPDAAVRQAAIRGLVDAHTQPAATEAIPAVIHALDDDSSAVRLVACVALSQLAPPGDRTVIEALSQKLDADRELQWNAAIGLARMGSTRGKLILLTMMDRNYWQKNHVNYLTPQGQAVDRAFTPIEVENYMAAAIDAAAMLNDPDLLAAVDRLKSDASVIVRDHAQHATRERPAAKT